MFWDKWIPDRFTVKKQICALEIIFEDDGTTAHYTIMSKKKGFVAIQEQGTSKSLERLLEILKIKKIPVALIANGTGVLQKKISTDFTSDNSFSETVHKHFPAIKEEDFYFQTYSQSDSGFITICRRQQIDEMISLIQRNKLDVVEVYLGYPTILGLKPFWKDMPYIYASNCKIELINNEIAEVYFQSKGTETVNTEIDEFSIQPDHILGFAAGTSYYTGIPVIFRQTEKLAAYHSKHLEKNKFTFLLITFAALAFCISTINLLLYLHFFDANRKLDASILAYQGQFDKVNKLVQDYQKNKGLIETIGILNKNNLSEFSDRIGATIPNDLSLTELFFNPIVDKTDYQDSLITFQTNQIIVRGRCEKSFIVNEWLNLLKMQSFIKEVKLEKFTFNSESSLPNFEIRIQTN